MKLLAKYNRINLICTVVIFLLACIAFSFLLRYVLINQVDEDLKIEQNEIISYTQKYQRLPEIVKVHDQQTEYTSIENPFALQKPAFTTSKLYNNYEQEDELIRTLTFQIKAGSQWWLISVAKSLEGTDHLIQLIIIITTITLLLMLAATFLINRFVLQKLWRPFYNTLESINNFKLGSSEQLGFTSTDINEFSMLNSALQQSLTKAAQDYILLKEFTENASHELQTPLAVIRSKLDLLIQDEHLTAQQSESLQASYNAVQKLSRMNHSLLLLTKIENRQFTETTELNLKRLIEEKLNLFKELWINKNITVTTALNDAFIMLHVSLADVLLNNLISNAIKHNTDGGKINIDLKQGQLTISNTGNTASLNTALLFTRFYKAGFTSENNGLGLSIVKQICEVSACSIDYGFENALHIFKLKWQFKNE